MGKAYTPINTPNENRYFSPANDKRESKQFLLKASNGAISAWALMAYEVTSNTSTGYVIKAPTINTYGMNIVGILEQAIATTDTDYAVDHMVSILVPKELGAEMNFLVGSGTFTPIDVGKIVALHSDSLSVAVDIAGYGVEITGYTDSTHGRCKILPQKLVTA